MYKVVFKVVFFLQIVSKSVICVGVLDELGDPRVESYQRCRLDVDCRENSFCFGNDNGQYGRCKCYDDYVLLSRNSTYYACLKVVNVGEPCVQDNQCFEYMGTLAKCDSTCQCPDGTHLYPNDGKCYESILLNAICKLDANCLLNDGSYGFCVMGRCSCNIGETPSQDNSTCAKAKSMGEKCTADDQCGGIPNSNCREICRCAMGYVMSNDKTRCLKAATYFGDLCERDEHAQCTDNLIDSVCINGKCTCIEGQHGFGSRCVNAAGLGESCTSLEECIPEKRFEDIVNCVHGKCQCLPGVVNEQLGCNSSSSRFPKILLLIFLVFVLGLF